MPIFFGGFDFVIYLVAAGIMLMAQMKVQSAYSRYSKMPSQSHLNGSQVAQLILSRSGIHDVDVEAVSGVLSDHYDPRTKKVRLSQGIYNSNSIAAISVAAHEVGHAIQHHSGYGFLALRNMILPAAIMAGNLGWIALIIGLIFNSSTLITMGIIMLMIIALFQLITLPVEFDASKRALVMLNQEGILSREEQTYAKSMLSAAAMTYVAALASTLLQILRFVMMSNRRK